MSALKIDESATPSGAVTSVILRIDDGVMSLVDESGAHALPENALDAVMRRYGMPFDASDSRRVTRVASLDLGDGRALHHIQHLARFDVIALDWLVYEKPSQDALCVMARDAARALAHLANAHAGQR